ncbi:UNVERIFIED_CONTAM: hypothetical protein ABID98_005435 [Brevibacillus sp. OAP136]
MTAPTEVEQQNGTVFARQIILEIHPPRSEWHWRAVPFCCGAGLLISLAGDVTSGAAPFFPESPALHHSQNQTKASESAP